jgi:hypothetical protein
MDHIEQAYSISDKHKLLAKELYKQSVAELVSKNYQCDLNPFTELSVIFGVKWVDANDPNSQFWNNATLYAEANTAFNYAHLNLGISNRFIKLAEQLVCDELRVSEKVLKKMNKEMNCVLTRTTVDSFSLI